MKQIIAKLDFSKMKNFCSMKDKVKRMRREATNWEKILAKHTSDKELLLQVHKELLKLNNKETNSPIQKWAEGLSKKEERKREKEFVDTNNSVVIGGQGEVEKRMKVEDIIGEINGFMEKRKKKTKKTDPSPKKIYRWQNKQTKKP